MTRVQVLNGVPNHEPGALWSPTIGSEARDVLQRVLRPRFSAEADYALERDRIEAEGASILGRCLPPDRRAESRTGLVVGHVQSGKTLSFTTVAAMARDNGYALVILIAGTSDILLEQSRSRLQHDLDAGRESWKRWMHFPSPKFQDVQTIEARLRDWSDERIRSDERPTILITAMKNWQHLRDLNEVLRRLDLRDRPAIVIDDEADQASLNTKFRQQDESTTYAQILQIRGALPTHTLLQYTATPQAPLLINIVDSLSPDFTFVLKPGAGYVGGSDFFAADARQVRTISAEDHVAIANLSPDPPPGLVEAMAIFFLGVVADRLTGGSEPVRSMLIHPSRETLPQDHFRNWVTKVKDGWEQVLELPEGDPDRSDLEEEFQAPYDELKSSVPALPALPIMLAEMPRWLRNAKVEVINAAGGAAPEIAWGKAFSWILIGGQLLDRGFTVAGLTVTYMPRNVGIGNADTVQQRARFYGYRKPYFPFCRLYLEAGTRDALQNYVVHENQMHDTLVDYIRTGRPLKEFKRAFLLDQSLRPTRRQVVSMDYKQVTYADKWYEQKWPHASIPAALANSELIGRLFKLQRAQDDEGDSRRTLDQRHLVVDLSLRDAFRELLVPYAVADGRDQIDYTGIQLVLSHFAESEQHVNERALVYLMAKGQVRERALDKETGAVEQPFQGSNARTGYPGDRAIRSDSLTIQVRNLRLTGNGAPAEVITALALWLPKRFDLAAIIQA